MNKSFLVFPAGFPGAALLLLRISIAAALAAAVQIVGWPFFDLAVVILIFAMVLGFMTRAAAGASALVAVYVCVKVGGVLGLSAVVHGVCAVALCMLGAGGFSIDALLFGRRVIKLDD